MDLQSILKEQVLSQVAGQIAKKEGLDNSQAQSAVTSAAEAILGGLGSNVKTKKGAESLDKALGKHDGSILNDVIGAATSAAVQKDGTKILGHIFGDKGADVTGQVAKQSGVSESTAASILSTVAPMILGGLGAAKKDGGLDSGGIADEVTKSAPSSGMGGIIMSMLDKNHNGSLVDEAIEFGTNFFKKK